MVDMTQTIIPKSDQINADSLIGGPRTVTVARVTGNEGNPEQPVNVFMVGEDMPFRPCKSMRRVMVKIWGADASKYAGRSMTIYRDPKVKWGGMEVGGIRISHMTGLEKPEVMALTETRSARKPYTVQPLKAGAASGVKQTPQQWVASHRQDIDAAAAAEDLDAVIKAGTRAMDKLRDAHPELHAEVETAYETRRAAITREGRSDEQMGDQFADDDGVFADDAE